MSYYPIHIFMRSKLEPVSGERNAKKYSREQGTLEG